MTRVTESTSSRVASLQRILGGYLTCRSKLDLLVFWGRYPGGWFGRRAVSPLTRASRTQIEDGLDELVQEGVIKCRRDGAMTLYALTRDVSIRRAVEELRRLTRSERDHLLHQSVHEHGAGDDRKHSQEAPSVLLESTGGAGW